MDFPAISTKGLPGNLLDAYRAGITAKVFGDSVMSTNTCAKGD
ncbi:MAG: hypothetical protein VYC92_08385 [SAR324 cluster bacterium]|nr:hypothetical protein [SAR324 cluster bacterium]